MVYNDVSIIFFCFGRPTYSASALPDKALDMDLQGRRMPLLILLTLAGSVLGTPVLLVIPSKAMPVIISILMIVVVFFSLNPAFQRPSASP